MDNKILRVAFDYNKREDNNIYHFNLPDNLKDVWLKYNELVLVDCIKGPKIGYCNFYDDESVLSYTVPKSVISRKEFSDFSIPYLINDEKFILEGFLLIKFDFGYLKYKFKDKGFVGIVNHMMYNNIESAIIKSTSRDFNPTESPTYLKIYLSIIDLDKYDGTKYNTNDVIFKNYKENKVIIIKFHKINDYELGIFDNIVTQNIVLEKEYKYFDYDWNTVISYGEKIKDILRTYLIDINNINGRCFTAFNEINNDLLTSTDKTFGYIIDNNEVVVFEFRPTDWYGVYKPLFVMKYLSKNTLLDDDE